MSFHVNYHQLQNVSLSMYEPYVTHSRFSRKKMLFSSTDIFIDHRPPINIFKKNKTKEHKKRTRSREKNDRYPDYRQGPRRDRSLTRYCMTTTTIVGDSYTAVDLNEIESVIPCREHRRHLYEVAQEDLPFPFSRFLRRIARSLARERSILPRRPRIFAPPHNPKCICTVSSLRYPSCRRLLLT